MNIRRRPRIAKESNAKQEKNSNSKIMTTGQQSSICALKQPTSSRPRAATAASCSPSRPMQSPTTTTRTTTRACCSQPRVSPGASAPFPTSTLAAGHLCPSWWVAIWPPGDRVWRMWTTHAYEIRPSARSSWRAMRVVEQGAGPSILQLSGQVSLSWESGPCWMQRSEVSWPSY